jgi:hypothetical protein
MIDATCKDVPPRAVDVGGVDIASPEPEIHP